MLNISLPKNKLKLWPWVVLILFIVIIAIRAFSGEDTWICRDNVWVAHGHPNAPAPTYPCK